MAWWPLGRNRREPPAGVGSTAASTAAAVSRPAEPAAAWQDLPSLQRTLAEPLRPVAVGDDFRQSLASFTDPSFVAPLSHHVDPSMGGLVDGLAAPGRPYAHPSDPDLPVPARPAPRSAPRVQRSVAWSGPSDLPTVNWELPGLPTDEPVDPSTESPTVTSSQGELSTPVPAPDSTPSPPPPGAGPVTAAPSHAAVPVQRSLAAVPTSPAPKGVVPPISRGELPVVVSRSTPEGSMQRLSTPEVQQATPVLPATPPEPAAEQAPLSGFAEAITALGDSDEVTAEPPVGPTGDDRPVVGTTQRLTANLEAPVGPASVPDAAVEARPGVAPASLGSSSVAALPVVSRLADSASSGGQSSAASVGESPAKTSDPARRSDDAPTLGTGLAQKPLAVQRAPLTGRTSPPAEAPVQRVEFLVPEIATAAGPSLTRTPAASHADPEVVAGAGAASVAQSSRSAVVTTAPVTTAPSVQRSLELPPQSRVVGPGSGERLRASFPIAPAAVQRLAAESPSRKAVDGSAPVDAVPETTGHGVLAVESATPIGPPDLPAPTVAHDRSDLAALSGPAVSVEAWVATPAPSTPPTSVQRTAIQAPSVQTASVQRLAAPAPSVQTPTAPTPFASAAPAPAAYPFRPVGSSPTVAVGPPIPVQRTAAHLTEAASSSSSAPTPLIVSRQVAADVPSGGSHAGGAMSFASMFGSTSMPRADETAAADEGFTSVQLQSADSAAAPSEPAGEPAPSGTAASSDPAPAPAGTPPTDLDEMARRLYEPLSARLRAELWLDRERSGVMSDA